MRGNKRFFLDIFAAAVFVSAIIPQAAQAQTPEATCTPVARIFETRICLEEINPEQQHIAAIREEYEEEGLDSEEALGTRNRERLRELLWEAALTEKFGAETLTPGDDEIALFNKALRNSLDASHVKNLETSRKLKDMLAQPDNYTKEQLSQMMSLLESVDKSIAFYTQRQQYKQNMPPEFDAMISEAERGLGESMVKEWKINQALYREYGGRLAVVDNTVLPIDAIGAFLDWIDTEAGLVFYDRQYKDVFRETRLKTQNPQQVLPESDTEFYKNYFTSIEWQFQNSN